MPWVPDTLPALAPGWVWLVGAGPGDAAALTLGAAQALAQADVVLHDALIPQPVLDRAHPDAVLEAAGKRAGQASPSQADISQRLVALARAGRRVVRLKGGDPFLFGRGPEEARDLVRAGVPFRVVPGVPAAPGGLAYAGIPATAGGVTDAVTFVTGHDLAGEGTARLDWAAIAQGAPAIVVFMALRRLAALRERLLAGGRDPDEPVAVVSRASWPDQRVRETTLDRLPADAAAHDLPSPALVVIGPTVRLRASLDWLGALAGRALTADPPDW
jgi:uroporphyrin-III C-methyltransferase